MSFANEQLVELHPIKWVQNGYTLCRDVKTGSTIFLHGALPRERVLARILKHRSTHSFAVAEKILDASPDRIPPECSSFPECGGCSFRHISYKQESDIKYALLHELSQIKSILTNPVVTLERHNASCNGYRNFIQVQAQNGKPGFFTPHTNSFINFPPQGCSLAADEINRSVLTWNQYKENGRYPFRLCKNKIVEPDRIFSHELVEEEIPLPEFIKDQGVIRWRYPSDGFFQTNRYLITAWLQALRRAAIEELIAFAINPKSDMGFDDLSFLSSRAVMQLLSGGETLNISRHPPTVELYCGTGLIGGALRDLLGDYTGYESDRFALSAAKGNFAHYGMQGRFKVADLSTTVPNFKGIKFLIANPPRAGISTPVIKEIVKHKIPGVLISSCNAHTLNRDLSTLMKAGYFATRVDLFDFFPRTPHLEVMIKLRYLS